jgi:hypothetical protein
LETGVVEYKPESFEGGVLTRISPRIKALTFSVRPFPTDNSGELMIVTLKQGPDQ